MSVLIRRAAPDDALQIANFNARLAIETEGRALDSEVLLQGVTKALGLAPEVLYFVAQEQRNHESRIVGQLMLTREWSDWRNGWMVWLQSVYVCPESRRQGVFQQLLRFAVSEVSGMMPVAGLRLYVEHNNSSARTVYSRLGFAAAGYDVMEMPWSQSSAPV